MKRRESRFAAAMSILSLCLAARAELVEYPWQRLRAKVLPTGNLEWAPEPFVFVKRNDVRYIDHKNGDDNNDGKSKNAAWKHHPWDREARGKAAEASGPITYVFKGGVDYRHK